MEQSRLLCATEPWHDADKRFVPYQAQSQMDVLQIVTGGGGGRPAREDRAVSGGGGGGGRRRSNTTSFGSAASLVEKTRSKFVQRIQTPTDTPAGTQPSSPTQQQLSTSQSPSPTNRRNQRNSFTSVLSSVEGGSVRSGYTMRTEGGTAMKSGGKGDFGDNLVLAALNIQKDAEKMKRMTLRQQEEMLEKKLDEHRLAVKEQHEWQVHNYPYQTITPHRLPCYNSVYIRNLLTITILIQIIKYMLSIYPSIYTPYHVTLPGASTPKGVGFLFEHIWQEPHLRNES